MRTTTSRKAAALVAASTLLLAGCSADTEAEPTDEGSAESDVVWDDDSGEYVMEEAIASGTDSLKVWFEEEAEAKAVIKAFHEKYPDAGVEYEIVAKVDSVEKMSLAGEAGNGADVFVTPYDQLSRAIDDGTAAPLGEYQAGLEERMSPTFTGVVSADDTMFGVPITTESIALFYNKTLLEELTGSDEPATTWEEIADLAEDYNDPGNNRWTIRFLAGEIYYAYSVLSSLGWHAYPDGDVADPGFESPELTSGLEYYAGLRDLWDVPSADGTWDTIELEFAKGRTPYVITGPWSFSTFDEGAEAEGFEYGVTTLPRVEGGDDAASLAGLQVAAVSGYTEYPAAARVFANFLATPEGAAAINASTGQIPALNEEYLAQIPGLADDDRVAGIVSQSANADLLPQVPEYFWETGNTMVVDVWDGLLGADEAAQKAVDGYQDLGNL
ncbi:extracellular solute-binding protein [Isoptericola aurantiacus]|uniref:extracellular solute-binding protein n=1 Tax=Isoptericola aurantiacus TaxID=3377839 RepID=UPI00383BB37D